jgi:hypothetical protein
MTFVITTRKGNGKPSVMNVTLAEAEARGVCKGLAENGMDKVILHSLSGEGVIEVMASWVSGGKRARNLTPNGTAPTATRVRPTTTPSEDEVPEGVSEAEAQGEGEPEDPADAIEIPEDVADEQEHGTVYSGYCVKCKASREFHTHEVAEMKNGTLMAKGTCPVCGGGVNRILPKGERPDPEWSDEDVAEETPKVEPEPEAPAAEFSDEPEDAKPVKASKKAAAANAPIKATATVTPRKRTAKKTVSEDQAELPTDAKEMQRVATCPKCGRKQPIIEKHGLNVFMPHSAAGVDHCPGSNTETNNVGSEK